ncbi:hypothetical protein AYL99_01163 [Fonsecaea erecta]|uniref:Uncharacterized protein n=1 Tax=Fonsecaea erecta TaxID=1367422 RepID=A0A179A0R8_9EURO|nr:hypothetical protein AYL99_01163 [Fonsecaea erecta]OAP65191.1 hypothetical protein AYL99_01163 [Fonsecaea erecta]
MDAIEHIGTPSKAPRCFDYINCAECATDLRVAFIARGSDQLVAQISIWQCFGGRDLDEEDPTVQRMYGFRFSRKRETQSYRFALPTRNLELLYNESLGNGGSPTNGLQQRHRWLHWWGWDHPYYKNTPGHGAQFYREQQEPQEQQEQQADQTNAGNIIENQNRGLTLFFTVHKVSPNARTEDAKRAPVPLGIGDLTGIEDSVEERLIEVSANTKRMNAIRDWTKQTPSS